MTIPTQNPLEWLPFGLWPSNRAEGRTEPEIVELRCPDGSDWATALVDETVETVGRWPVTVVVNRLASRAMAWHQQVGHTASGAKRSELDAWVRLTHGLADRLPFGDIHREMRAVASRLERVLRSPEAFFERFPSTVSAQADVHWRVSTYLWAMDQLIRAVNQSEAQYAELRAAMGAMKRSTLVTALEGIAVKTDFRPTGADQIAFEGLARRIDELDQGGTVCGAEYLSVTLAEFWPAMFESGDPTSPTPPFADYNEAQKRVANIRRTIKPHASNGLMISILTDVLAGQPLTPSK